MCAQHTSIHNCVLCVCLSGAVCRLEHRIQAEDLEDFQQLSEMSIERYCDSTHI